MRLDTSVVHAINDEDSLSDLAVVTTKYSAKPGLATLVLLTYDFYKLQNLLQVVFVTFV